MREINFGPISDIIYSANRHHQGFIPFLGPGVSISSRIETLKSEYKPIDKTKSNSVLEILGFDGKAALFVKIALEIANIINSTEDKSIRIKDILKNQGTIPSSQEIVQMLSQELDNEILDYDVQKFYSILNRLNIDVNIEDLKNLLIILNRVFHSNLSLESLPSTSQYFEYKIQRNQLWVTLKEIFEKERKPTITHQYLARVAKYHTIKNIISYHYLILTTNYDNLMETALDELEVPYVVMSVISDYYPSKIRLDLQFSNLVRERDRLIERLAIIKPIDFILDTEQRLVILYKIFGSFNTGKYVDNIIISENDYISFVRKGLDNMFPGVIGAVCKNSPFLFLGYSIRDWILRSIFLKVNEYRPYLLKSIRDFAILKPITRFDRCIFDQYNIMAYEIDLNDFIRGLMPYANL